MEDSKQDNNQVATLIALLNTDGATPMRAHANTSNSNAIVAEDSSAGSDAGPTDAKRDSNMRPVAMVASSAGDGTPVALYINSSNQLLIDSN